MTNYQENLSRPGIIDAKARYRAAARQLRNIGLDGTTRIGNLTAVITGMKTDAVLMKLEFYISL